MKAPLDMKPVVATIELEPGHCHKVTSRRFVHYQCTYSPRYEGYCGVHSPVKQAERSEKRKLEKAARLRMIN